MRKRIGNVASPGPDIPWMAFVLIVLSVSSALAAAGQQAKEYADKGRAALQKGDYEDALGKFERGLEASQESGDNADWAYRFGFYRAVTLQQEGVSLMKGSDSGQAAERLRQAAEIYDSLLEQKPDSGILLNNLAKTWQALGDGERAKESYRRAIALDDLRRDLYLDNYAGLLDELGEVSAATKVYAQLALRQPASSEALKEVVQRVLEREPQSLAGYLWETLKRGHMLHAQEGALLALESGASLDSGELLAIVAASLSQQVYVPADFAGSSVAARLQRLQGDAGAGAADILAAHTEANNRSVAYLWWRRRDEIPESGGVRPVEAFRTLLRSLGDKHREAGEWKAADRYYRLALSLWSWEFDTRAFRALTSLYAGREETEQVYGLAEEYVEVLFLEKGAAYERGDDEKKFEYHMALGELYAALGRWGDEHSVATAIFQLEGARKASARMGQPSRFPPQATLMLSRAYAETGRVREGYAVRFEQAQSYQRGDDTSSAQTVLQDLRGRALPTEIPERQRNEFEAILTTVPEAAATAGDLRRLEDGARVVRPDSG